MKLIASMALRHLLSRRRQSIVSLIGIVIGVAFFLAISSMMKGSENDFIRRLVDNSPHITVSDEFRSSKTQPVETAYPQAAIELRSVKPLTESRGIRGYKEIVQSLQDMPGVRASAVMAGSVILNYAGKDVSITLNGMIPEEMKNLTTIEDHMQEGSVDDLIINPNGIIIGEVLRKRQSLNMGDNITLAASTGQVRTFKIVGIFKTGRESYDRSQAFVDIKRAQAMLDRINRANSIIIKLDDPQEARTLADKLESKIGYKAVSWQEASEDIMSTLAIRNTIMYSVVSAVLVVAAFGIYNIISTVVMEKQRDIAILKSMGFKAGDIRAMFLIQGALLGIAGVATGIPLGCGLMLALMQIRLKPPGASDTVNMTLDWGMTQFLVAGAFALCAALLAAYLPARKASKVLPVDILRGGT